MRKVALLLVLVVLALGCTQSQAGVPVKALPAEGSPVGTTPSGTPQGSQAVKEFTIVASQFKFEPSTITVNRGDSVRLRVKSVDVTHGFDIEGYDVERTLAPGQEVVIDFVADKSGEFEFYCNTICGLGHTGMRGKLIVK